jgi:hypothetical protein
MTTCNSVGKFIIPVCNDRVAKMRTGSGRGALGLVPLFRRIAVDHESPKLKRRAATKEACSAMVPLSLWMSSASGIQ